LNISFNHTIGQPNIRGGAYNYLPQRRNRDDFSCGNNKWLGGERKMDTPIFGVELAYFSVVG
jgi:hypothetical protein